MTEADAEMMIAHLAAAFPHANIQEATLKVYVVDLVDLEVERAAKVIQELRRTSLFFPAIADIRRSYAADILQAPKHAEAYAQAQGPKELRHPLVQKAKRMCGDESDWRETPSGIMGKRFRQTYEELFLSAMAEIIVPGTPATAIGGGAADIVRLLDPPDTWQIDG